MFPNRKSRALPGHGLQTNKIVSTFLDLHSEYALPFIGQRRKKTILTAKTNNDVSDSAGRRYASQEERYDEPVMMRTSIHPRNLQNEENRSTEGSFNAQKTGILARALSIEEDFTVESFSRLGGFREAGNVTQMIEKRSIGSGSNLKAKRMQPSYLTTYKASKELDSGAGS